jgi:tetratricopeptide (TPR) repeat protein
LLIGPVKLNAEDKKSVGDWIDLSRSYRQSENYSKAEDVVKIGLKVYKGNLGLRNEFAEISMARKDWPEAIKRWSSILKSIDDKSRLAAVYSRLSTAYRNNGDYGKAEAVAKEGMVYHPKHAPTLIAYAEIPIAQCEWPEAIKRWRTVLSKLSADVPADAWQGASRANRLADKPESAKLIIEMGLTRYPKDVNILIEHAEVITLLRQWRKALTSWRKALRQVQISKEAPLSKVIYIRFNISVIKRIAELKKYSNQIERYVNSTANRKYAVYTSFTGSYDTLKLPERIDENFDYYVFTDEPVNGFGVFKISPLNQTKFKNDGPRATRYPKTHPHVLLNGYEVALWVDSSLMIVGDLMPLIKDFLKSRNAIGSATHPTRASLREEFQACIDLRKDNPRILKKQLRFYENQHFGTNDLSNNGVLIFNLRSKKLAKILELWWEQICRFSKRDQLSFNYALFKNSEDRYRITRPPADIRNSKLFIYTPHHTNYQVLGDLYGLLEKEIS